MQKWQFIITREAEIDLDNLDNSDRIRISEKLNWFQNNFENITPLPLIGEWRGFFKFRIGEWRIIYEIEFLKRLVAIHLIGHRSKVYSRKKK